MIHPTSPASSLGVFQRYQQLFLSFGSLLLGLSLALIASAFIQQDSAAQNQPENVFRVCKWITAPDGTKTKSTKTAGLLAPALNSQLAGTIDGSARFMKWPEQVEVTNFNRLASTEHWAFADPAILDLFELNVLHGDAKQALETPGQLILTDRFAKKLFGAVNPVGKTLMGLGGKVYTITAVVQSQPGHSALQFEALASWASTAETSGLHVFPFLNNWTAHLVETFIRLEDDAYQNRAQQVLAEMTQNLPHPAGCTDLFLQPLSETTSKTGAKENAEQDRFGARVAAPDGRMVLMAGRLFL